MFKIGHWGASLLVWAPVGGSLLAAGYPALALIGGAVVLSLSRIPDLDHDIPVVDHRGITHTLLFAILVGAVVAAPFFILATAPVSTAGLDIGGEFGLDPAIGLVAFGFSVGFLGIGAHLFADALTPAGVPLLFPFSRRDVSLHLVQASNTVANYGLFVLGLLATVGAVGVGLELV